MTELKLLPAKFNLRRCWRLKTTLESSNWPPISSPLRSRPMTSPSSSHVTPLQLQQSMLWFHNLSFLEYSGSSVRLFFSWISKDLWSSVQRPETTKKLLQRHSQNNGIARSADTNSVLIVDDNYDSDTYGHNQKFLLWKNEIKIVGPISKSLFVMSESSQLSWESLSSMLAFIRDPSIVPVSPFEFSRMEIKPLHRIVYVGPTFWCY